MKTKAASIKKKSRKKLVVFVVAAVLLVALVVALVLLWPMLSMSPAATGPVADTDIIAVRSAQGAVYLLPAGEGYIAIDTGSNAAALQNDLSGLGIDPQAVSHVLMTHSDYDHVNGLGLFSAAQVCISEDELQPAGGSAGVVGARGNSLPEGFGADNFTPLTNGQQLELGGRSVTCIKSPGHTPGSMSYLVDGQYLFTGDALRVSGETLMLHPFTMDEATAQTSIAALHGKMPGCQWVLTAHYGYHGAGGLQPG